MKPRGQLKKSSSVMSSKRKVVKDPSARSAYIASAAHIDRLTL